MSSDMKAKKRFGQNFLNNKTYIKKIIEVIKPKNKKIIEIGPGLGALTKHIIPQAEKFVAFEIDDDIINVLDKLRFFENKNSELFHGDFLEVDLSKFEGFEIVGNIPYNITSKILFKIFDNRFLFKRAVFMVQKEVADRLVAQPNSKDYSKLSVTAQYLAKINKEISIGRKNFTPSPKVDSAVVSLDFYQDQNDNYEELKDFFKLCFLARRKKLIWSLQQKYKKSDILKTFKELGLAENIRIQQLDLDTILKLYNFLKHL